MIETSKGVKIYFSHQEPKTFDEEGFKALEWTELEDATEIYEADESEIVKEKIKAYKGVIK